MQSKINSIIEQHSLRPGMPMRNINGEAIPASKVLDDYSFVFKDDYGVVHLLAESPISGEQREMLFSQKTFAALQSFEI